MHSSNNRSVRLDEYEQSWPTPSRVVPESMSKSVSPSVREPVPVHNVVRPE